MNRHIILIVPLLLAPSLAASPLKQGDTVPLGPARYTVTKLHSLPYVESDYTRRFNFDSHDNPKLKTLRTRYRLDEVIAPGVDEFDQQVLLLDWVHHRLKKFGRPTSPARGALDVLAAGEAGHTFFCAHYADVLVSAAASLGWVNRALALRRPDHLGTGSTEHSSTEIWSNQHRKWVLFDPTFAMYVEKDGVPLNAWELRHEWLRREGKDLTYVLGKQRKRYRTQDLPVPIAHHPGFGDLSLDASALNVYAFIGYIPNTNWLDAGPDYAKMFITQDDLCAGTKWHKRQVPAAPATDPYFPINQAALTLTPTADAIEVKVQTMTPNFRTFLARFDSGEWKPAAEKFTWTPHAGANKLEVKAVNQFNVPGPISTAQLQADPQ